DRIGVGSGTMLFQVAGTGNVTLGRQNAVVRASVLAPLATLRLKSSSGAGATFVGTFAGRTVRVSSSALLSLSGAIPICGDNVAQAPQEDCDGTDDLLCPGHCQPDCHCPPPTGTAAILHAVGPSVLQNATSFGLQMFGENFVAGALLELSDK